MRSSMYGYVVVNKPELKIKEYDMYRSYYCGLCEELLSDYGINGQISISYDMTFLLVLLTGLYEPDTTYKEARCIAHPVHKHPVRRNKISAYVADMNVLMTYYKCVDDWQDDRKLMKKLLASSLTNKVKRIEKAYSQKARIIKAALDRMSELENNNESNIDLLAEQFGIIMAQILCMKNDEWYDTLKVMGNSLGRFIYILDAYDDLLEDKKKGRYNALRTYENYSFNPRLVLHYTLPGNSFVRWKSDISNASPSLGDLSAVEQIVDSLQIRRGNPNLKAYLRYHTELTYEWQKGIFYSNLWGAYDYQPNAIMDEKYQDGDKIVQTWDNQKDWQKLSGRLTLRVGPIKDMLQFSFTGGVNHYMSHGNTYSHTYTNWYCNAEASFNYKQFSLYWQMNTNWNNFWGETLSGGENIQVLVMYYTHKNLRVGLGAFNPFTDNYKQQTENWNKYASYKKTNYVKESSQMFLASVSYNFSFGRKFKAGQRRVNNSDNDSGVMSIGK